MFKCIANSGRIVAAPGGDKGEGQSNTWRTILKAFQLSYLAVRHGIRKQSLNIFSEP